MINDSHLHPHREVADETHPLEGGRYHTHENGTLEIERTTEEDAGSYSCWVDNTMGKAVITANLDIRSTVIFLFAVMTSHRTSVASYVLRSHSVI